MGALPRNYMCARQSEWAVGSGCRGSGTEIQADWKATNSVTSEWSRKTFHSSSSRSFSSSSGRCRGGGSAISRTGTSARASAINRTVESQCPARMPGTDKVPNLQRILRTQSAFSVKGVETQALSGLGIQQRLNDKQGFRGNRVRLK